MHLANRQAFQQFLYEFHVTRDYFECHEILEDLWKELAPRQKHHELVGFILLATGMYHWRRGNQQGACRSLLKAHRILHQSDRRTSSFLSLFDRDVLIDLLMRSYASCEQGKSYQSISLPVSDDELVAFLSASPFQPDNISDDVVHKHRLRDRSDVIRERERAKRQRHSPL